MTDQSDAELAKRLRKFEGSDALGNGDFALLEEAASRLERYGKAMEALEMAEVTLRLDGERMATAGMSTRQNAEAHRIVSAALHSAREPMPDGDGE